MWDVEQGLPGADVLWCMVGFAGRYDHLLAACVVDEWCIWQGEELDCFEEVVLSAAWCVPGEYARLWLVFYGLGDGVCVLWQVEHRYGQGGLVPDLVRCQGGSFEAHYFLGEEGGCLGTAFCALFGDLA